MSESLFTDEWGRRLCSALGRDEAYRTAAASWKWSLSLNSAGDDPRHVLLDLKEGECRAARAGTGLDEVADIAIRAEESVWRDMLSSAEDPLRAVMTGRLELVRGRKTRLIRYAAAARELLRCARAVSNPDALDESDAEKAVPALDATVPDATVPDAAVPDAPVPDAAVPDAPAPNMSGDGVRHESFRTLSQQGLSFDSFPMQLYAKAKRLGIWDPAEISFDRDTSDWRTLSPVERDVLLRLISMFQAGEEAVTLDLLPLMTVIAREGRLEEEMYLTTFLFEEAKHTEFFSRFLAEVPDERPDADAYQTASYSRLFARELPDSLSALSDDPSPAAQVRAAVTYNMIVEGTLAETGYHALYTVLDDRSILPGLRKGIELLQRDESRHIAYGVHLLSRLIAAQPSLIEVFDKRMNELLPVATDVIAELFEPYNPMPFGLSEDDFVDYATAQFGKRLRRITEAGTAGVAR